MANPTASKEAVREFLRSRGKGPGVSPEYVAKGLGCSVKQARFVLEELRRDAETQKASEKPGQNTPKGQPTAEDKYSGNEWTAVRITSERAKNEKDAMRICGADPDEWAVKEWAIKIYEGFAMPRAVGSDKEGWERPDSIPIIVPLYSISVKFERKVEVIALRNEIEELKRKAEEYAPQYPHLVFDTHAPTGNMLEISIADPHFGALIWGRETGGRDWDLKIARETYQEGVASLVARTGHFKFDRVLYVVGNDQQNADNRQGTTERGTQQQNDGRYQKVWWTSSDCSVWAVEALCTVAPQVDVVVVPGNHDPLASFHLGEFLRAWFRNCPNVRVLNEPTPRKFVEHGIVGLMFEHGNNSQLKKYPGTMASQYPSEWGRTRVREIHSADKHHREAKIYEEFPGAVVRILPSLRPPCTWSNENHFIGALNCAEAYAWNDREGLIGMGFYSVIDDSVEAA